MIEPEEREHVADVMTMGVIIATEDDAVDDVARMMRAGDVGAVVVADEDRHLIGILTDRDIVVRVVAEGLDPRATRVRSVCSRRSLNVLRGDDTVDDAVRVMREHAVRRVPVVEDGTVVGVVSLGDLARIRDPGSVLSQVSAAPPNA